MRAEICLALSTLIVSTVAVILAAVSFLYQPIWGHLKITAVVTSALALALMGASLVKETAVGNGFKVRLGEWIGNTQQSPLKDR